MEEKTEKNWAYESLLDLTRKAEDPNLYFSVQRIYKHIIEKILGKNVVDFQQGRNFSIKNEPKRRNFHGFLEELVKEGKAKSVIADTGTKKIPYKIYRAVI